MVIERIGMLINGFDPGVIADSNDDLDERLEEDDQDADAEEINLDFVEYLDSLEEISELDIDSVLGVLTAVEYGCKIHILKTPENKYYISEMPMAGGELNMLQKRFLGKPIGTKYTFGSNTYEIVDIRRT